MPSVGRLGITVCVALCLTARLAAQPTGKQELLEYIRETHQASRSLIRTCSCRVDFSVAVAPTETKPPKKESCSGRFWYSPDAVRGQVSEFGNDNDYLWKDTIRQSFSRDSSSRKLIGASRSTPPNRFSASPRCDAWIRGLLVLNSPGNIYSFPFEELLTMASRPAKAERKKVDGNEMIAVNLSFDRSRERADSWDVEIQFDPTVNYLVRRTKYVQHGDNGRYVRDEEVIKFREFNGGVYFPERIVGQTALDGHKDGSYSTVITDIHVNETIPEGIFRFRYPEGVRVNDSIHRTNYRVDAEGRPITAEKAYPARPVPPPHVSEAAPLPEPGMETHEEPRPASRLILPISLLVLVVGVSLAVVRRWRQTANAE